MSASKYKEDYPEMLINHMSQGFSYESFGAVVEVGKTTMYDWEKQHPEWKKAKGIAFNKAQQFMEQRLIAKIAGQTIQGVDTKKIDTTCLIFALKTRFHETYGDRNKVEHSGEVTMPNIGFFRDAPPESA